MPPKRFSKDQICKEGSIKNMKSFQHKGRAVGASKAVSGHW